MSKFPTTINTNDKIKPVHNAMPSALEGRTFDESVALTISKLLLVAALMLIFFQFSLNAHQSSRDNNIL